MKLRLISGIFALGASILSAGPLQAADAVSPVAPDVQVIEKDGWTFTMAPYFWAAGLSGDMGVFGLAPVHVDMRFSDILENLDFAAMAIVEARRDRFSIVGDILYTKLSGGADTRRGILASSIGVTSETFAGLLSGGYSVLDGPSGRLDVVGGVRVWSVDTEISLSGGLLGGRSRSDGATWVDGMVGLRGNYSITPKVYLTGWGLAGAGGADSDWDVAAALGYKFNDRFSAVMGYRALGVDYSDDGFEFDAVQQGPIFGAVFKF